MRLLLRLQYLNYLVVFFAVGHVDVRGAVPFQLVPRALPVPWGHQLVNPHDHLYPVLPVLEN